MKKSSSSQELSRRSVGTALAVGGFVSLLIKELDLYSIASYWDDRIPWVVLITVVGASMWLTRLRWLVNTAALALGGLWLVVVFTPFCTWLARDLARREAPQPADAVYVLGSTIQGDGELSTEAMSRLLHGLELIGQGFAPRLIVPELHPPTPSYSRPAGQLMKNLGMSKDLLTIGPTYNTRDEALAVASLFKKEGWHRLLLVTSPTHSRRAAATFEKARLTVVSSPSVQTRFDLEQLDWREDRILAFPALVHERLGYWVYQRRGWVEH